MTERATLLTAIHCHKLYMKALSKGQKALVTTVAITPVVIILLIAVATSNKQYENILYPMDLLASFCSELNDNRFDNLEEKICSSSVETVVNDLEYFSELWDIEITVGAVHTQLVDGTEKYNPKCVQISDDILCLVEPIRYTTQDGDVHTAVITVYFYKEMLAMHWDDIPRKARLLKFRPFIDTDTSLIDVLRTPEKY